MTPASVKLIVLLVLANTLCGPTLGVGAYQWALNVNDLPAGIVLSVVAFTAYALLGMNVYEAACQALTTVSTAGFSRSRS